MRAHKLFICLLFLLVPVVTLAAPDSQWDLAPSGDLRVRQEVLDGVYHFAPDPDRNWIRVRTRAGLDLAGHGHEFSLRLASEFRRYIQPDLDFDWDELIVDRLAWSWAARGDSRLTLGRQDIIWPGGFLMLEAHPLDGSRSIYHNAIRWQQPTSWGRLDLAVIHNPQQDDFVPAGDENRDLANGDETGVAARLFEGPWQGSLIWKRQQRDWDPTDLHTYTLATRYAGPARCAGQLEAEFALQYQIMEENPGMPDGSDWSPDQDGWAFAGQAFLTRDLGRDVALETGGFYYSGSSDEVGAFRAPWGNWPKWSELYIYSLIGESRSGEVHVAAWENIAAPRMNLRRTLYSQNGRQIKARLGATYLLAPDPDWEARGLLTQAELQFTLGSRLTGHLLWEMLDPGDFHDGTDGNRPFTESIHFLRWQLACALP
jgi:hypothetical protein